MDASDRNGISLGAIWQLLSNRRSLLSFGVLGRVLRVLIPLLFGILLNEIVAMGKGAGCDGRVVVLVLILLTGEFLVVLIEIGAEKISASSFAAFSCSLKNKIWAAACKLSQLEYDRVSVGEWERKISYDVEMVTDAVRALLNTMMNFAVTFLGVILIILVKQPALGCVFFVVLAFNVLTHIVFKRRLARVSNLMRKQFYREGSMIYGCIEMHPLLRAFSLQDMFSRYFARCLDRTRVTVTHNWRVMADFRLWLQIEFWGVKAVVLCVCVWALCRGVLSVGAVVSFTLLVNQMIECVSDLMIAFPQLDMGYESSKALNAVMVESVSKCSDVNMLQCSSKSHDAESCIVLDNVSFHYPDVANNVIEGFSARIVKGEFVCFLGRNGAGKSTLAKILLGQYEPTEGRVIRGLSRQAWVSQRITIFEGSIFENVRLMDESVSRRDVLMAIDVCGLTEYVEGLAMGIDTQIKADTLSGGELQALGIARALVRNPDLIVVDEITNNLDVVSRRSISRVLENLKGKCTIISITHDMDVMDFADRTFVFCNGRVNEVNDKEAAVKLVMRSKEYA